LTSLGEELARVSVAFFLAILASVVFVAFRERGHGKSISDNDVIAQQARAAPGGGAHPGHS
jgi:hypothetical protein